MFQQRNTKETILLKFSTFSDRTMLCRRYLSALCETQKHFKALLVADLGQKV